MLQRLTLASLDLPRTPAASSLVRFARETLVGGRSCRPSEARPRRLVPCTATLHLCLGQRLTLSAARGALGAACGSLRSQGPSRRTLHIAQVTSDLAALDCALPPHYSALPAPQGESGRSDSSENGENGENGSDKRALTG
ncbi:hypothetical protein TYRP_012226 [Tyrophagus putrescentiae]|nr:hypothetical protein TYRP_012226 [Tyrophagus putrescentiae]